MRIAILALAACLTACGSVDTRDTALVKPVAGKPTMAGIGDTVLELRITQPLPNVLGRADMFGRTKDAGSVTLRYLGAQGNEAVFVRRDIAMQSNETTLSRTPLIVPTVQTTSASGAIGPWPVYGESTTAGSTVIPATPSQSMITDAGQMAIKVGVGRSAYVEGRQLTVLKIMDGGVEYTVR